ncbi:hypothetical protein [Serratia sp. ME47]|nr:hypothetical protein [Serratia sp. ME47]
MDIKEQKSTLKALLHLSEVYSRFGNIPHFSVVGWLGGCRAAGHFYCTDTVF